ncbi:hypothetical protein [Serratia symbiotica]|uniref:hypothetical protein n=1 Tax=Serratia symbiotica TaxID=138074 RepID=UPI003CC84994
MNQEIWVRAQSLALGYWQQRGLQPLADDQGWFYTQDRCVMEQVELRVFGRLDNLFFSGGEGVQPEDIERVLATHPQILQVFVVKMDDMEFGQRPVAVIDSEQLLTLEHC